MKIFKRKSTFLFLLSILFFGATITGFLILLRQTENLKKTSVELATQVANNKIKNSELENIRTNIKSTNENRDKLYSLFITTEETPGFINTIEDLGKQSGLKVTTKSVDTVFDETLESAGKESLVIEIQTEGSWQGTMQYLQILETLPFDAYLSDFKTGTSEVSSDSKNKKSSGTFLWKTNFNLKVIKAK